MITKYACEVTIGGKKCDGEYAVYGCSEEEALEKAVSQIESRLEEALPELGIDFEVEIIGPSLAVDEEGDDEYIPKKCMTCETCIYYDDSDGIPVCYYWDQKMTVDDEEINDSCANYYPDDTE